MDTFMVTVVLMAVCIIEGIITIATKKIPRMGTDKYTEESIRAYAVPRGITIILLSLSVMGFSYALRKTSFSRISLIAFIILVIMVIVHFVIKKKMLVKK